MNDKQTSKRLRRKNLWSVALLIAIVASGAMLTWWIVARADREMREDLLQQTRQVAQALNIQSLRSLSGTEADISSPNYLRLKEQLATVRSANPQIRFVYLMGRNDDGAVFFFVDSEPANSKDYSPPGQIYDEVSEGYRRVFASRTEAVEGPVADRWGKWVSALVPILDPKTAMYGLATKEDAQAMVHKAVDFYRKNGRERLLKEVNNPQGEFRKGDLYAFVYDRNMTWLAHPVSPELVGQNWIDKKDWSGGKYFRRDIQQAALSKGNGWVEFEYNNPVNGQHDHKTTYIEGIDDIIICSGAYKGDGEILAVLGMDSDASAWNWMLARAALPPILLTLTLAAILLVGLVLLSRRSRIVGASSDWRRRLALGLVVAIGLVLTMFAAWMAHERETHDRNEAFAQLATVQTGAIGETLHNIRDIQLESLARLYSGKGQVIPEEFRQFTTYLTNNPAVAAWEWIPAVPAADKTRFEEAARRAGLMGFEIWQKDVKGNRVPVSGRAVYYPVFRAAPLEGNEQVLGYDLGSEPLRRAALEEAAQTGLPTCTNPVVLVQETGTQNGMLTYRPVFGSDGSKQLHGFAVAVLRMGTLLKSAGSDKSAFMELSLLHKDAASESLATTWHAESAPTSGLFAMRPVLAFGKTFAATAHAGQGFMHMHPMRAGLVSIVIGLVLTAAFTTVINLTLSRREKLLQLVDERTHDLRESEALQRLLLDNMPVGVVIIDPITRVIERVNEHVAALFGAPVDHLLGHRCHSFLCVESEGACPVCDLGQDVDKSDGNLLRADGSLLSILKTAKRIKLNGQEKVLECFVDVSDRKRAEEALLETNRQLEASDHKLKALFNTVNDAILIVDTEMHILDVNNITCGRLGYGRDELLKMTPQDFITPEYASKVSERIAESQRAGSSIFETAWVTRDGKIIPTEMSSRTIAYEGKSALLGVARDITDRKKADNDKNNLLQELKLAHDTLEARVQERTMELTDANAALNVLLSEKAEDRNQLERSKKRLQTFFDGITEPMFMTAVDSGIVIANRAAMEYSDFRSFPDVIGRQFNEIMSSHYGAVEDITTALGSSAQTSLVLKRNDQGSIDRLFVYPVHIDGRDTGEDIIRIVDVTKEKVLEQQIVHTEKLAALGLLVAGIAHEINNPNNFITFNISVLRTYLGVILSIVDDYASNQSNFVLFDMPYADFRKDILKLIDDVEQGAQRISSIVRELREFSHKGDVEERSLIAPLDLVERVIDMCKRSALKEQFKISVVEENAFPVINLPTGTCEQVLVNLIINAMHAADKDQAYVEVIIRRGLAWRDYLTFIVKDNGKGMEEATRARIFDPFFTLKPRGEGTGLGLYISKMLINKLGGDITCDSTIGEGSVFIVTLPKEVLGMNGVEGA